MFTGLVSDIGTIDAVESGPDGARLRVRTGLAMEIGAGDSIAVDGVCLTAAARGDAGFGAEVMNQTIQTTTLGSLERGDRVNLELAVRAGERLGGHLVQGHVDGVANIAAAREDGFALRIDVDLPPELRRYVVERGSVALDGVSLTVAALTERGFEVSLVPETRERTTLGEAASGRWLNVEVDMVARYVERLVSGFSHSQSQREAQGDG
jgi:riboflavin synthase